MHDVCSWAEQRKGYRPGDFNHHECAILSKYCNFGRSCTNSIFAGNPQKIFYEKWKETFWGNAIPSWEKSQEKKCPSLRGPFFPSPSSNSIPRDWLHTSRLWCGCQHQQQRKCNSRLRKTALFPQRDCSLRCKENHSSPHTWRVHWDHLKDLTRRQT